MITALFLIIEPGATWTGIAQAKKSSRWVLALYLLPTLVLSISGELYGLLEWGRRQKVIEGVKHITCDEALQYAAAQLVMSLLAVFFGALLLRAAGEDLHGRRGFSKCFTLVAYTLSPLFLVRLLDAFPAVSPWITFGVGITLSVAVFYSGLPRLLESETIHAFAFFSTGAVLLVMIAGLSRLVTWLVLEGKPCFL
jgi:Yip1 domain